MLGAELGQELEGALAPGLPLLRSGGWGKARWRRRRGFGSAELNAADIQILFEAVQLQEIGEFEGSDVAAPLADLPRHPPAGRVTPASTLRNAMEVIMNSNTSVAVIDDGGEFGGVVTLEAIRAELGLSGADPQTGAAV